MTGINMSSAWCTIMSTFEPNYVERWHSRFYSQCRGVFVTLGHKLYSKTVLRFRAVITKVPTLTSEGVDVREGLASYRGGKQDPPGSLIVNALYRLKP